MPADQIEIDHREISPFGYRSAIVYVHDGSTGWVSEKADCTKSEKFNHTEIQSDGWKIIIQADSLLQGITNLFVCLPKTDGSQPDVKPIVITRNDARANLTLNPPGGEYGKIPEIHLAAENATIAYTLRGEEPGFHADGAIRVGNKYVGAILSGESRLRIRARAITSAGIVSGIVEAEYSENSRLRSSKSWDILAGPVFFLTTSSVSYYLPNGIGGVVGIRRGLDDLFQPQLIEIQNRNWLIPSAYAEAGFLQLTKSPYNESAVTFTLGPEWQYALSRSRRILLTTGLALGLAQISVKTPAYSSGGLTTSWQTKIGMEYYLRSFAPFIQIRYTFFSDQSSPLAGLSPLAGIIYNL